jgi:hypothetical protein
MTTMMVVIAAAISPVMMNTASMVPRILPNLLRFAILATALVTVIKTKGTTMVNMRFKKMSPSGCSTVAFLPRIKPRTLPMMMERSRITGNL